MKDALPTEAIARLGDDRTTHARDELGGRRGAGDHRVRVRQTVFFAELETQPLVAHHARKDCGAAQRLRPVLGMRFGQFGQRDDVVVSTRHDQIDAFTPQDSTRAREKSRAPWLWLA